MEHCLSIIAAASYFILNDHLQPSPHDMTSFLKLLLLLFLETHISVRADQAANCYCGQTEKFCTCSPKTQFRQKLWIFVFSLSLPFQLHHYHGQNIFLLMQKLLSASPNSMSSSVEWSSQSIFPSYAKIYFKI